MNIKEFGKRLQKARTELGMSQRSLGLALGLSDKTISSYESSRSYPSLDVLFKISTILNKPIEYFTSSKRVVFIEDYLKRIITKQSDISKDIGIIKDLINTKEKEE